MKEQGYLFNIEYIGTNIVAFLIFFIYLYTILVLFSKETLEFKNREIEKIRKIAREKENKSFYSTKPGHADKTKKVSTHATSCMRRGADIVVEYILREIYDVVESGREIPLEKLNEYKELLEKICYKLNYQSANIDNFFIEHNNAMAKKKKKKEKLKEHRRHKKVYK